MKNRKPIKLTVIVLVCTLFAAAAAGIIHSVTEEKNKLSRVMVGGEIGLLTLDNGIENVYSDSLTINRIIGQEFDTIEITETPSEYDDDIKTLMIVGREADLGNIKESDIIALDQDKDIKQALVKHIDDITGAGTYTVLMGGSKGNIYTGTFVVGDIQPTPTAETEQPTPTATTASPTATPTASPTATPTASPTASPTATPTASPTATPTASPTASPTATPTASPTATPTASPTATLTARPTATPTATPTASPTATPTASPTATPTATPTASPTATPTTQPIDDSISPIGVYEDKVTIEKDGAMLIISPKDGTALSTLTLYTAVYDDNTKAIKRVTMIKCNVNDDGKIIVPIEMPAIENNQSCKLMLWDDLQIPVINVISQ